MSLEQILKRMVKGLFPWQHQGSGINYPSRSDFHHQTVFKANLKAYLFKRAFDL